MEQGLPSSLGFARPRPTAGPWSPIAGPGSVVGVSTRWSRHELRWVGALLLLAAGGCADERADLVRKTIGPAGGLISSHDEVLTLVFVPGALDHDHEIEIFPSDEPPLVFGPAYRVRPNDIELSVDVEVTYRRVLPANTDGVAVAAIRLDDYTDEMGHWVPLPRLSIDVESGAVLASDSELSLYYGMLEFGGGATSVTTDDPTGDPTVGMTSEPTGDPTVGMTSEPTGDSTMGMTSEPTSVTDPTSEGCGNGSVEPGEVCFEGTDLAMGGGPVDVALGDFDDDGQLDVATANGSDDSYSVRLGDGSGGFGSEQGGAAGGGPVAIGAGDFDMAMGDDLVVIAGGAGQMSLLQSQGDGTFMLLPVVLTGGGPSEVLVADYTDDGGPDIVVANQGSGTVTYFSFAAGLGGAVDYNTGMVGAPVGLAFGQFNLDTDSLEDLFTFGGGSYSALAGDGVGLADSPVGGALGTDLRRAVGGNFDDDAPGDAAVADFAEGGVWVLLGDGAANGFAAMDFYATGAGAVDVAAADVTGDGDLDLIVVNSGDDTVTVLEKTGASTWGNPTDFAVAAGPSGVGVGNLDGDDVPDIVVSAEAGNAVTILLSNP